MKKKLFQAVIIAVVLTVLRVEAQNIPSLQSIVNKVRTNTLPSRNYSVDILQTFDASAGTSIGTSLASGAMLKQNTFRARYMPTKGLSIDTAVNLQRSKTMSASQQPVNSQTGDLKVTVDLSKVFESADKWQHVNITNETLNSRDCYVITGEDGVFGFRIWIDVANSYASRLIVRIQGNEFSTTDIQYGRVDGLYWLPSEIVIHHALDGTQISQRLERYQFQ